MTEWQGYILLEKPGALSMGQWRTVLVCLYRVLNHRAAHPQPAHRLHYRLSRDSTKVILEAEFEAVDLEIEDLARLPAYISNALDGAYTPAQVRSAMRNKITIWGSGSTAPPSGRREAWMVSGAECRAYLAANRGEWEPEEE